MKVLDVDRRDVLVVRPAALEVGGSVEARVVGAAEPEVVGEQRLEGLAIARRIGSVGPPHDVGTIRWVASRYGDPDLHEELGILTQEIRARKAAEAAAPSEDTAGPPNGNGHSNESGESSESKPAASALTDEPPAVPANCRAWNWARPAR